MPDVQAGSVAEASSPPPAAPLAAPAESLAQEDPMLAAMAEVAAGDTIEIPRPVDAGGAVDLTELGLDVPDAPEAPVAQESAAETTAEESGEPESVPSEEPTREDEVKTGPGMGARVLPLAAASLITAAGAASGYYLGLSRQFDPVIGAGLGAVVGIVLGWVTTRWMVRRS